MQRFKKIIAVCLAITIAASLPIYAEESMAPSEICADFSFDSVLKEYFEKREDHFSQAEQASVQGIANLQQNSEITAEEMRLLLISKMEEKMDFKVVSAKTSYSVSKTQNEGSTVYLDVYEWTDVDYVGESGLTDTFGYGVDHKMTLEKNGSEYKLISDTYDEGPLTGMSSELSNKEFKQLMSADYSILSDLGDESENAQTNSVERTVSGYNPYEAANYADKWVYPNANGGQGDNTGYYNTSQYATNYGADCANYVSQCMYAGGVKMDSTSNSSGWWYDRQDLWSTVWFTADPHFKYFADKHISYKNLSSSADSSNIIPGNPVYHDANSDGTINHATICVGYDSSGVPIVNSHSDDYFHVRWNYGGSTTKYGTVMITGDDVLGTASGAAALTLNQAYYAKLDNTSDTDCFKFTPSKTATYTFKTTGNTNTYGILKNASGTTLASDDNSGSSYNFSISYMLTAGSTYYIYVSSVYPIEGFYGLIVS